MLKSKTAVIETGSHKVARATPQAGANPDSQTAGMLGLHRSGKLSTKEAIGLLRQALQVKPDYPELHNHLATALQMRGEMDEALSHWEKAVALKPDYAEAYGNLARAFSEHGRTGLALACWERAVALNPDNVEMHCGFAVALRDAGRPSEAIDRYEKALAVAPDHVEALFGIAGVLETEGRSDDATRHYELTLVLNPDLAELRFRVCTDQLPALYLDEAEIECRRAAYRRRIEQLCADVEAGRAVGDIAAAVGVYQPFFLPYQGHNDRDLQGKYGSLVCRIVAEKHRAAPMPPPPLQEEKVRVGIVSGMFRNHPVWKLMINGWLSQLDRSKFELFGYHTDAAKNTQTEFAAARCNRFVQGPLAADRWREEILADRPHILIYPEIGMDPVSAWLAAHRLAPTQCATWGHPNTTGYPTIDYFLSSSLMEPPKAEQHYTERLVRLPNLSIYYEPLDLAPAETTREALRLRPSSVIYWCGQSLFKYLPQYDAVFPRIAKAVGDCQFAFIVSLNDYNINGQFRGRLCRAFAALGLDAAKHCVFLPRLPVNQFVAAIGQCDVVLDSIGWSGGTTTLEGLAHDVPIVTMPGPLMRGRHTMAILRMMGVTETIAETLDDYVAIAARLGRDLLWRAAVSQRISENKKRVYRDSEAIVALEGFLCRVARRGRTVRRPASGAAALRRRKTRLFEKIARPTPRP